MSPSNITRVTTKGLTMKLAEAAATLAYYIRLALGEQLTPDQHSELNDAVAAFHEADVLLEQRRPN